MREVVLLLLLKLVQAPAFPQPLVNEHFLQYLPLESWQGRGDGEQGRGWGSAWPLLLVALRARDPDGLGCRPLHGPLLLGVLSRGRCGMFTGMVGRFASAGIVSRGQIPSCFASCPFFNKRITFGVCVRFLSFNNADCDRFRTRLVLCFGVNGPDCLDYGFTVSYEKAIFAYSK